MKRRIHIQLIAIAVLSMMLTMFCILLLFYDLFRQQVQSELETTAVLLAEFWDYSGEDNRIVPGEESFRITLLDGDGTVLFDNGADSDTMDNHSERPEILQAKAEGEGFAVRHSGTLATRNFYYALMLEDGKILRVSKESRSILSIFSSATPALIIIGGSVALLCGVLAVFLTKALVRPIEQMAANIDDMDRVKVYKELEPFAETIRKQHEDIVKNVRVRQDFTANVSHELKTPLTVISGYSELIENGMAKEDDIIRFSREIHKNATRLLTLINDILRLSELDAGAGVEMERIDLYEIADACVSMLQISADRHEVWLSMTGEKVFVRGNRQMLEELLFNLTDNAIRYNEPGGRVEVRLRQEEGKVILQVEDTGIGIPREHCDRIFERFYRVDKSRSKKTGGTGLGLAIVKHIVECLDAQLTLESKEGVGTKISVLFATAEE